MMNDHLNAATLAPGQHLEPEELMLYALEMLTAEERRAVEAHLSEADGCALCEQELTSIRNDLGLFGVASVEAVGFEEAPARSRERLMAEVTGKFENEAPSSVTAAGDGTGRAPGSGLASEAGSDAAAGSSLLMSTPASTSTPAAGMQLLDGGKARGSRGRVTAWIGWAVAAGMAIAATHFYQQRETLRGSLATQSQQIAQLSADQARARGVVDALTDRGAQRVTLTLTKAPAPVQPTGRATYLANKGTLIFLASHMEQLPAGKTYELWVIPASGAAPVPAGTFRPDERGNASVVTARLQRAGSAKAFGVTIEESGGSTTPTMPILMAGS